MVDEENGDDLARSEHDGQVDDSQAQSFSKQEREKKKKIVKKKLASSPDSDVTKDKL